MGQVQQGLVLGGAIVLRYQHCDLRYQHCDPSLAFLMGCRHSARRRRRRRALHKNAQHAVIPGRRRGRRARNPFSRGLCPWIPGCRAPLGTRNDLAAPLAAMALTATTCTSISQPRRAWRARNGRSRMRRYPRTRVYGPPRGLPPMHCVGMMLGDCENPGPAIRPLSCDEG
jgi:hypothetical protein